MSEGAITATRRRWIERGFVAYAVLASTFGAALFARGYPGLAEPPFWRLLVWQAPGYLSWALVVPFFAWLLDSVRSTRASLAASMALGAPIVLAHAFATEWWLAWAYPVDRQDFDTTGSAWFVHRVPIDLLMYSFLVGVMYARGYAYRYAEERARTERLEKDLIAAQLDALRSRLQPHFLFNALQSIAVLIKHDADGAVRMTRDLAGVLRLTLQRDGTPLVSLEAEVQLLEHYIAIERIRFADRLRVSFTVDAAARRCLVPDLLLQPLVENAIQHGLGPNGGGEVSVRAWVDGGRLHVEVTDDGVGAPEEPAAGIGLGVTRSRLEGLFPDQHVLALRREAQGTTVRIEIPALPAGPGGPA